MFSHPEWFRAELTEEKMVSFWHSGQVEIDGLLMRLQHHYGPFAPKSAIDFGCGVGRLSRAIGAMSIA